MMKSTIHMFRSLRIAKSRFRGSTTGGFSDVPARYAFMFQDYRIIEWPDFNKDASNIMAESDTKRDLNAIQSRDLEAIPGLWYFANAPPMTEGELVAGFFHNIMQPLNIVRQSRNMWRRSPPQESAPIDHESRREPDLALMNVTKGNEGSSSSRKAAKGDDSILFGLIDGSRSSKVVNEDERLEMVIAGELKRPNLYLGSNLTSAAVQQLIKNEKFPDYNPAFPFFQAFSYMMRSSKGVSFLSNFEQTRFFKIKAQEKLIYMSPLVRRDQVLNERAHIPHLLQTFLYAETLADQLQKEEVRKVLKVQLDKARCEADEHEKNKEKERAEKAAKGAGASSSSANKNSKDSFKSGGKYGKKKEDSSWSVISPATLVLDKCKVLGILGEGLCGLVKECDYDGVKVALKVGLQYNERFDEEDCFTLVKNEIEIYEVLEELQGKVVPRLVVGGLEKFYNPSAMVIVTERVGMGVEVCEDRMVVGEKELSREDLIVMKEKGLEGLKKLHECGMVHMDTSVRNIRVEMKDGKVEKVWWIDLSMARVIDYETEQAIDKTWHKFDMQYTRAIDFDIDGYTNSIDAILEKIDSQYSA